MKSYNALLYLDYTWSPERDQQHQDQQDDNQQHDNQQHDNQHHQQERIMSQPSKITSFPIYPNLEELYINNQYITELHQLKNLKILICSGCSKLSSLPQFPQLLEFHGVNLTNLILNLNKPFPKIKRLKFDDYLKYYTNLD